MQSYIKIFKGSVAIQKNICLLEQCLLLELSIVSALTKNKYETLFGFLTFWKSFFQKPIFVIVSL